MTDQPRRKGADPSGISPEHLFAAGFATSFLAAIYMAAAACRKTLAADSNVTATLSNRPRNEGGATLDLSIDLPNFSTVEAAALVERAREYCLFIEAMQDKIDIGFDIA
ncbi:OsmC family protein [Novosphingobium sp. ST904]|uniref:OsmC family protein n=1 Tax=Novosphingobium sp. ST904 TaxID=1684385 RepID=UPI001A9F9276|nr:OsmC family protein [Novosphingobium sp. ST904]